MKIGIAVIGSLLVIVGVLFGMAKFGFLPTQKWADSSPAARKALVALHLAKPKKKPVTLASLSAVSPATPDPALVQTKKSLDAEKQELDSQRTQLAQERARCDAQKQKDAAKPVIANASMDKVLAIYATMSPEDVVRIDSKLPDPAVAQQLAQLDEKKAGQILTAMPPERAAKLSLLIARLPAPPATQVAANP